MKTASEKANEVLEQLLYCDLRTEVGADKAMTLIRVAIKEQDRDTRHACAEAVLDCPEASYDASGVIYKGDAEKACMNVKAV